MLRRAWNGAVRPAGWRPRGLDWPAPVRAALVRVAWLLLRLVVALVVTRLVLAAGPFYIVATLWVLLATLIDGNIVGLRDRLTPFSSPRRRTSLFAWGTFAGTGALLLAISLALSSGLPAWSAWTLAAADDEALADVPPVDVAALPASGGVAEAVARLVALLPPGLVTVESAPDVATRRAELAEAAARYWEQDVPRAIGALESLRALEPDEPEWAEKLYAAYVNDGDRCAAEGREGEAEWRYDQARDLDPARAVAQARLGALGSP